MWTHRHTSEKRLVSVEIAGLYFQFAVIDLFSFSIVTNIQRLEDMLCRYSVPMAFIDGDK